MSILMDPLNRSSRRSSLRRLRLSAAGGGMRSGVEVASGGAGAGRGEGGGGGEGGGECGAGSAARAHASCSSMSERGRSCEPAAGTPLSSSSTRNPS